MIEPAGYAVSQIPTDNQISLLGSVVGIRICTYREADQRACVFVGHWVSDGFKTDTEGGSRSGGGWPQGLTRYRAIDNHMCRKNTGIFP